jgi:hypothetical protein
MKIQLSVVKLIFLWAFFGLSIGVFCWSLSNIAVVTSMIKTNGYAVAPSTYTNCDQYPASPDINSYPKEQQALMSQYQQDINSYNQSEKDYCLKDQKRQEDYNKNLAIVEAASDASYYSIFLIMSILIGIVSFIAIKSVEHNN